MPELMGYKQPKHEYLYWEYFRYHYGWQPGDEGPRNSLVSQAVRMGNWKGIRTNILKDLQEPLLLYNLEEDPREENNMAGLHPEITEKIRQIMKTAHRNTEYFQARE